VSHIDSAARPLNAEPQVSTSGGAGASAAVVSAARNRKQTATGTMRMLRSVTLS
jgi:pectate lyase